MTRYNSYYAIDLSGRSIQAYYIIIQCVYSKLVTLCYGPFACAVAYNYNNYMSDIDWVSMPNAH